MGEGAEVEAVGEMLSEGEGSAEVGGGVERVTVRSEARSSESVEVIRSILCGRDVSDEVGNAGKYNLPVGER